MLELICSREALKTPFSISNEQAAKRNVHFWRAKLLIGLPIGSHWN
jgi:hypothetical protein